MRLLSLALISLFLAFPLFALDSNYIDLKEFADSMEKSSADFLENEQKIRTDSTHQKKELIEFFEKLAVFFKEAAGLRTQLALAARNNNTQQVSELMGKAISQYEDIDGLLRHLRAQGYKERLKLDRKFFIQNKNKTTPYLREGEVHIQNADDFQKWLQKDNSKSTRAK